MESGRKKKSGGILRIVDAVAIPGYVPVILSPSLRLSVTYKIKEYFILMLGQNNSDPCWRIANKSVVKPSTCTTRFPNTTLNRTLNAGSYFSFFIFFWPEFAEVWNAPAERHTDP